MGENSKTRAMHGRRQIFTNTAEITRKNIIGEINAALSLHYANMLDEDYLYWYRRGIQPILSRTKEIRPEICNKVLINNADQVVVFKNGYFLPESTFYKPHSKEKMEKVNQFNEFAYAAGKPEADDEIANWFHTVGLGVLYVAPCKEDRTDKPFEVHALDPRSAFVVYSMKPGHEPVYGASVVQVENNIFIDVYTKDSIFHLNGCITAERPKEDPILTATAYKIAGVEENQAGEIPIIEYQYNENRMSAFEGALSLMDTINLVESNRMDGIEQFIQSLIVTYNCAFEEGTTANKIRQYGMLSLKSTGELKADIKILSETLDQTQTQTTIDDLYAQLLEKTGMPSVNRGGGSSSDNGVAVFLRDGWAIADTFLRNTQSLFKKSNRRFEKVALAILKKKGFADVYPEDMELQFPAGELTNILTRTQGALNMKELGLAPEIVLAKSGISSDPASDIKVSQKYIKDAWDKKAPVAPIMNNDNQPDNAGGDINSDPKAPNLEEKEDE